MSEQRQHKRQDLLMYLTRNADRLLSLSEISEQLSWQENSVSGALSSLTKDYPTHLFRRSRGIYEWLSEPVKVESVTEDKTDMLVEILHTQGKNLLVRDTDTKKTFLMKPFELDLS